MSASGEDGNCCEGGPLEARCRMCPNPIRLDDEQWAAVERIANRLLAEDYLRTEENT